MNDFVEKLSLRGEIIKCTERESISAILSIPGIVGGECSAPAGSGGVGGGSGGRHSREQRLTTAMFLKH